MELLELYPFETAVMRITQSMIFPPIYYVQVSGKTQSLNPEIDLVNTRKTEDGYLVVELRGNDGMAIGSADFERSIDVQQVKETKGVMVKGAGNKVVKLAWQDGKLLSKKATTGLFHLHLRSQSNLLGAPILHVSLGVDSVNNTVSGVATVTQPLAHPVVSTSHVTGNLIYESLMNPGVSKIRIDLSGYPEIHWPSGGGIGPVIQKNFTAIILFDENWTNGTVQYQYFAASGWIKENQSIEAVS